jgi:hypothetical protein
MVLLLEPAALKHGCLLLIDHCRRRRRRRRADSFTQHCATHGGCHRAELVGCYACPPRPSPYTLYAGGEQVDRVHDTVPRRRVVQRHASARRACRSAEAPPPPAQQLACNQRRVARTSALPRLALGIEVIDFCFYGKTSHAPWCPL